MRIKTKKDANRIASWAKWLQENHTDFRQVGGQILQDAVASFEKEIPTEGEPKLGVHWRNSVEAHDADYQVIETARLESVKMMSHTSPEVFKQLKKLFPNLSVITRLYDDRFGVNSIVPPEAFLARMVPIIQGLLPYCNIYEIHNEPGHPNLYEGWGLSDKDAESFNRWCLRVVTELKSRFPNVTFLFPGLAIPHNDLRWLAICEESILACHGLACHLYWQNSREEDRNHLSRDWGLRSELYHEMYPTKRIYVTEAGCSNAQSNLPYSEEKMARDIEEHFLHASKPYVHSINYFILSSSDESWKSFAWRKENGEFKEVVRRLANRNW